MPGTALSARLNRMHPDAVKRYMEVPCPLEFCHAAAGETCKTKAGVPTNPHTDRLIAIIRIVMGEKNAARKATA